MSIIEEYVKFEKEIEQTLSDWVKTNPEAKERLEEHIGPGRSVSDYLSEYNYKYAIAGNLAYDLNHPQYKKWFKRYEKEFISIEQLKD